MALTVWDQSLGASREATQEDIDIMQAKVNAFGRFVSEVRLYEQNLSAEIGQIQDRYRRSAELSGSIE